MPNIVENLTKLLINAKKAPEKDSLISEMLINVLNEFFTGTTCEKVYITSGGSLDTNPVIVIPKIVHDVLNVKNLTKYSVEINTSLYGNDGGYSANDAALFMIHELVENVVSDNTFMRFKNLLIKYMTDKSRPIFGNSRYGSFSYLLWISVFSRTDKTILEREDSYFSYFLKEVLGDETLVDIWNSIVRKFISINGGDPVIITDAAVNRKDKSDLLTFNKFCREYTSDEHCKYPGEYKRVIKYMIAGNSSKLFEDLVSNEPLFSGEFPGKDIFSIFDDTKIIYESIDNPIKGYKGYLTKYNELELDVLNVETNSAKLEVAVKLRNFNIELSNALKTDFVNSKTLIPDLINKTENLITKLNNIKTSSSVIEDFI